MLLVHRRVQWVLCVPLAPSGRPVHARRVHGRAAAQRQHGAHRALLRHLHRGDHLPRVHQDALRLGRLPDQKGKGFVKALQCISQLCRRFPESHAGWPWQAVPAVPRGALQLGLAELNGI